MIIAIGGVFGALLGAYTARRRKGSWADIAQYTFIYAMIFAILGLFISLALYRTL